LCRVVTTGAIAIDEIPTVEEYSCFFGKKTEMLEMRVVVVTAALRSVMLVFILVDGSEDLPPAPQRKNRHSARFEQEPSLLVPGTSAGACGNVHVVYIGTW
jgi:hypothetical protein